MNPIDWSQFEEESPEETQALSQPQTYGQVGMNQSMQKSPQMDVDWSQFEEEENDESESEQFKQPEEEGIGTKIVRGISSAVQGGTTGYLMRKAPVASAISQLSQLGAHEAIDPQEIDWLKAISEREGVPFNEEKYREAAGNAMKYSPTPSGIANIAEAASGLPLESKSFIDRLINLSSNVASLNPGSLSSKALSGAGTAAVKGELEYFGVPEPIQDVISPLGGLPGLLQKSGGSVTPKGKTKQVQGNLIAGGKSPPPGASAPPRNIHKTNTALLNEMKAIEKAEVDQVNAVAKQKFQKEMASYEQDNIKHQQDAKLEHQQFEAKKLAEQQQYNKDMQAWRERKAQIQKQNKNRTKTSADLRDQAGDLISRDRFHNPTEAGIQAQNKVRELRNRAWQGVSELYTQSRGMNDFPVFDHTPLVNFAETEIQRLESIPTRNALENNLLRAYRDIDEALVIRNPENGAIEGFRPIQNQTLIDQIQSLRQRVETDFMHGTPSNAFLPLIEEIDNLAINNALNSGRQDAVEVLQAARQNRRYFGEVFDNEYTQPFADPSNRSYTKLHDSLIKTDTNNVLRQVLSTDAEGQAILSRANRDLVENYLGKFFKEPQKHSIRDFETALREVEAVIPREQTEQLRTLFNEGRNNPQAQQQAIPPQPVKRAIPKPEKTGKLTKPKPPKEQKGALETADENLINQKMNTPAGINQIKRQSNKTEAGKELWEVRKAQKTRSIVQNGKINDKSTPQQVRDWINSENNYENLVALHGEELIDKALSDLERFAGQQGTIDTIKKAGKAVSLIKFLDAIGITHVIGI